MSISVLSRIYLSVLIWHIGGAMVIPFSSIWLRSDIGEGSYLVLALVISIPNLIALFGITFVGSYTDKSKNYKVVLLFVNLVGAIEYIILTQINTSIQYLIVVAIGSLVFPAYYPIVQAYATNLSDPGRKGEVTSKLLLNASIGWFIGSIFAGIVYRLFGMKVILLAAAIFCIIAGILASVKTVEFNDKSIGNSKINGNDQIDFSMDNIESTSFWNVLTRKSILSILSPVILLDFLAGAFFILGSVYFYEKIELSADYIGYTNAAATVFGSLILLKLGNISDKYGRKSIYVFGLLNYPIIFLLLSIYHQPIIVLILWSIPLYAVLRPIIPAMISDVTNENERSRGMSIVQLASSLAMTTGALFGGWMADTSPYGLDIWLYLPAMFGWLCPILGYIMVKETLNM
ncbi:MAG: MFS transporter [Candidatus Heimdallarchaeota archaeon]|nr:MFS transporter [Candidatus Heimdallarchaeota archaeon]MDH5645641.1 MFS transporter [Candidatus Heimdallarchaeota archaeon]